MSKPIYIFIWEDKDWEIHIRHTYMKDKAKKLREKLNEKERDHKIAWRREVVIYGLDMKVSIGSEAIKKADLL